MKKTTNTFQPELGKVIYKLRCIKRMKSMYDFAMASKISAIRIAAIEKGKCMPTKIELKRFCKALDCKVEILMMLSTTLKNVPKRKHFLFKTLMPNMKKMTWEILKMKKMTWEILKQK